MARFFAYAMICLVGVDVITESPARTEGAVGATTITLIGAIAAIGGACAAAGVINRLWRLEFIAIAAVGGALAVYSAIDWFAVLFLVPDMPLRGPAIVSAAFWLLVYRGAGLHVFSRSAVRAKRQRRLTEKTR